jgi:integrase
LSHLPPLLGAQIMAKALTDALIRAATAPKAGRTEIADARCVGLVFRVTDKGAKSWSFRFRDPTSRLTQRATIGVYPDVSLSQARERADDMRRAVAAGNNPNTDRERERTEATTRTFKALAERYMAEHSRRHKRPRSADEDDRNLRLHILPTFGTKRFDKITRAEVIALLEGLVTAGTPTAANRVHALLSAIFNFAIDNAILNASPAARLKRRGVERVAKRTLSDDEIRLFWPNVLHAPVSRSVGLALRLALLTGARAGEIAGMRREELADLDDGARAAWTIPGERTKNGRTHIIPLGPLARETIAQALEMIEADEPRVFPSKARADRSVTPHALAVAMARFASRMDKKSKRRLTGPGAATWQTDTPGPHDLRRTLATRLSSIGIAGEDVAAVLNHVRRDVTSRHYDQYQRLAEKRRALAAWEVALSLILNPTETVVALDEARAARKASQ